MRSDGTPAGTFPLTSLAPNETQASTDNFAPALGAVFFTRYARLSSIGPPCCAGLELWRTDGSQAGTVKVASFDESGAIFAINWIGYLTELPPHLLFFKTEELWASQSSAAP